MQRMFAIILFGVAFVAPELAVAQTVAPSLDAAIAPVAAERKSYLQEFYHDLHRHPELAGHEERTSAAIAKELQSIGWTVTTEVGGHGVVGILKNGAGPVIALRTDMDALPIHEETGLPYASETKEVMHACGHDMHMTVMMGTAYALRQLKDRWHGTVIIIAQPAEENGTGAKAMIDAGLFTRFPKPNAALAFHVGSSLPVGKLAYRKGYALANVDFVDITVYGKGGHGAMPETTIDPIVTASQIVLALQTIVSREIAPVDPAVVTVGSIHGGTKHNIIPDEVKLQLTIRNYKDEVREHIKAAIARITKNVAAAARAPEPKIEYQQGTPALYNDPALVDRLLPVMRSVVGDSNVVENPPAMVGEDFSQYGREGKIPTFMMILGVQPTGQSSLPAIHSAKFAPLFDPSITIGITTMTKAALALLAGA